VVLPVPGALHLKIEMQGTRVQELYDIQLDDFQGIESLRKL
jgi:hypothetical protein